MLASAVRGAECDYCGSASSGCSATSVPVLSSGLGSPGFGTPPLCKRRVVGVRRRVTWLDIGLVSIGEVGRDGQNRRRNGKQSCAVRETEIWVVFGRCGCDLRSTSANTFLKKYFVFLATPPFDSSLGFDVRGDA